MAFQIVSFERKIEKSINSYISDTITTDHMEYWLNIIIIDKLGNN